MTPFEADRNAVEELARQLRARLAPEAVCDDADLRALYASDLLSAAAPCSLVVRPRTVEELATTVSAVARAGFALAPRGGGLTYVGGYAPARGRWISVDMGGFDRIVEVSPEDMFITVETGVTWKQIYDRLSPLGLRLPFFGTFSGRHATVGGGLSNGALFFGSARYGTAADALLGLTVMRADGALVSTGAAALKAPARPGFRAFGPDLTQAFTHEAGAFGIKVSATLRLIHSPRVTRALSFRFADRGEAVNALCDAARHELAEDLFLMDPAKTEEALGGGGGLSEDLSRLARIIRQDRSLSGVWDAARIALAGRRIARPGDCTLHAVLAARSSDAMRADIGALRRIARSCGGEEIPPTIPKAARAELFPPPAGVFGAAGARWIALNAKVPHSQAMELVQAGDDIIERFAADASHYQISVACLMTALYNNCFSYEPVVTWPGAWTPLHHHWAERLGITAASPPSRPEAEHVVAGIRTAFIAMFERIGAASTQIGRTYPFMTALRPETAELLAAIKATMDPADVLNPGVLGFGARRDDV